MVMVILMIRWWWLGFQYSTDGDDVHGGHGEGDGNGWCWQRWWRWLIIWCNCSWWQWAMLVLIIIRTVWNVEKQRPPTCLMLALFAMRLLRYTLILWSSSTTRSKLLHSLCDAVTYGRLNEPEAKQESFWQSLPSSKFSHTNLLIQAQLQTDARFDVLMLRHEILHVYVVLYALSEYGTQKLIRDFLVTWLILGHVINCCKRPIEWFSCVLAPLGSTIWPLADASFDLTRVIPSAWHAALPTVDGQIQISIIPKLPAPTAIKCSIPGLPPHITQLAYSIFALAEFSFTVWWQISTIQLDFGNLSRILQVTQHYYRK